VPFTNKDGSEILGNSCSVTEPIPQLGNCPNDFMPHYCAYSNHSALDERAGCYDAWSLEQATNSEGLRMICVDEGVWCPVSFEYEDGKCKSNQDVCDWGYENQTANNCQTNETLGHPGFLNNLTMCIYDFNDLNGIEESPWPQTCCELLRVPLPGADYLFYNKQNAIIY